MTFWIVALVLAAVAAGLIVLGLLRGGAAPAAAEADIRVYRDQLAEVGRDLARGVIPEAEAERLKVEIGRRLLEADRARGRAEARAAPRGLTAAAAVLSALAVVAGSVVLYRHLGAPGYPDLPLAVRLAGSEALRADRVGQAEAEAAFGAGPWTPPPDADPDYLSLVERLRAVVAERPGDRQGLALLAEHEAALGNFAAAHAAQAALIAAKGDAATADDHAALAGMLILAAGGYVSPEAEAALMAALERDPRQPWARFYAGLLYAQIDRPDMAFRFWQSLLAESRPEAPWVPAIRAQIEEIAWRAGEHNFVLPPPPAAAEGAEARGPTAEDMAAAATMDPDARLAMVRGMVEGLAARLAAEGGPAVDWAQLIRALAVLGEAERAGPVLAEARAAFADDPAGLAVIEAAAAEAGLPPPGAAPGALPAEPAAAAPAPPAGAAPDPASAGPGASPASAPPAGAPPDGAPADGAPAVQPGGAVSPPPGRGAPVICADLAALAAVLPRAGAVLGLDLGERTIGLALSDARRRVATPLSTIRRARFAADAAALLDVVRARGAVGLILGLPLNMDGSEGPRAQATRAFARNLDRLGAPPLAFWDERLSTVAAERALLAADTSRKRRAQVIDHVAAAYILQGALDRLTHMDAGRAPEEGA